MLSPNALQVKEFLQAYANFEIFIDEKYERLRYMETKVAAAGIAEISDMPKAHGGSMDSLTEYLIRKERLEEIIGESLVKQDQNKKIIYDLMEPLNSMERYVIEKRYISGLKWGIIITRIYGQDPEYASNRAKFDRRVYRCHDYALEKMAENW